MHAFLGMTDLAETLKEALRMTTTKLPGSVDLSAHGIEPSGRVYRNPSTSLLYTHALARGDGRLAEGGPLVVDTGKFTGRSPKDKFLVDEPSSTDRIWWGEVNQKLAESNFDGLRDKVTSHLGSADALFVIDAWAGADPAHRIGVRIVTAHPYHALFAKTMFIDPSCSCSARSTQARSRSRSSP
jgi:phosphoenolpyruvate carboxykinase (ATP)